MNTTANHENPVFSALFDAIVADHEIDPVDLMNVIRDCGVMDLADSYYQGFSGTFGGLVEFVVDFAREWGVL